MKTERDGAIKGRKTRRLWEEDGGEIPCLGHLAECLLLVCRAVKAATRPTCSLPS